MRAETQCVQAEGVWRVSVRVGLDRDEESRLFLLGDILISWPTEGMLISSRGAPLARGCMYVSELQSRREGLALDFGTEVQARRVLEIITAQLETAAARLAGRTRSQERVGAETEGSPVRGESAEDGSMQELIAEYTDMPGVAAALLISDQGLVVAAVEKEPVDAETIAALVAETLTAARRFGQAVGVGGLDTMTLEYERIALFLAPFSEDVILVLVKRPQGAAASEESTLPER